MRRTSANIINYIACFSVQRSPAKSAPHATSTLPRLRLRPQVSQPRLLPQLNRDCGLNSTATAASRGRHVQCRDIIETTTCLAMHESRERISRTVLKFVEYSL